MKKVTVIASGEINPNIETKYAINGNYGIELIWDKNEAVMFAEAIECEICVSHIFPGTHEEWAKYIRDCVIERLQEEGLTYSSNYGVYLK
jgi:hypothetical protein